MTAVDNFDLVKKLLVTPWYNLILISLLVIPVFVGAWLTLLNTLGLALSERSKKVLTITIVIIYLLGIIIGKIGFEREQSESEKKIVRTIQMELSRHPGSDGKGIMGFRRIRERYPLYTEEILYKVVNDNPNLFEITPMVDLSDPTRKRRDPDDPFGIKIR